MFGSVFNGVSQPYVLDRVAALVIIVGLLSSFARTAVLALSPCVASLDLIRSLILSAGRRWRVGEVGGRLRRARQPRSHVLPQRAPPGDY